MKKNKIKFNWIIIFFLAPAFIIYTYFLIVPMFSSLRMSFYTADLFKATEFVGLANFIKLFTTSPYNERLLGAFLNNIKFFIFLCSTQNIIGLILAIFLSRNIKGFGFFRSIFFLPTTMSILVVGFLFQLILNPIWGLFDKILKFIGLEFLIRPWLGDPLTALPLISIIGGWQYVGLSLILFTAAISGIDKEIFEAARVDGASPVGIARYITIPLIKPVIGILLILTYIANFTGFDLIYAMATQLGAPNYSTDVFGTFFYRTTFGRGTGVFNPDVGLGSAIASVMFVLVMIGVILWIMFFRKKSEEA